MAADRIKGITIEIGGNTSELSKALSSVDKEAKITQANLRDINKALKFEPGNIDLLREKQSLLNQRVDEAKEKLRIEKEALEQLKNTDGFDENSRAAKDLQTQIALDETELKKAQGALKDFGSVGQQQMKLVSDEIKNVGSKLTDIGSEMTKKVSLPIAAVGTASVAAWKEVDSAMDIVATKTVATGDALTDMQSRVTSIAESIPTSFEEAGTAIGEVNTRFGLTGDALEDLSTKFIQFADINGTDVNTSIDTVQKALNAFGLDADQAGALLDTLNKVGQDTGVNMDQLSSLMVSNATAFQGLGLNAADAATLLGKLEKSGVDTSTVITGMSKVQKEAIKEGVSMQDALRNALTDSGTALEVFGAKAGPKLYESFQNGILSVDDFVNSTTNLNDALGSVSDTYNATLDPIDQMTMTMNTLKQTGADIVNSAGPMLAQIMEKIAGVVQKLAEAWNNLSPAQQETIIKIAAVAAAIGPVISIIGGLVSTIGTVISVISTVASAIGAIMPIISGIMAALPALGTVIAAIASPIGIVVAAIAAVIAIGVLLYKNWDEIKEKAIKFGEAVKNIFENIKNAISEKFNKIKEGISNAANAIKSGVTEKFNAVKNAMGNAIEGARGIVSTKLNNIKSAFEQNGGGIKGAVAASWTAIKEYWKTGFDVVNTLTHGKLGDIVDAMKDKLGGLASSAWNWGRDIISGLVDGIRDKISSVAHAVSDVANTIRSYIHFSEPDVGPLKDFNTYMPDMTKELAQGMIRGIPQIESAMDRLTSAMVPSFTNPQSMAGTTTNTTSNSVSINVYGAQGQDINELANIIEDKITNNVVRRGVAFG